jgi:hypothetical protein
MTVHALVEHFPVFGDLFLDGWQVATALADELVELVFEPVLDAIAGSSDDLLREQVGDVV